MSATAFQRRRRLLAQQKSQQKPLDEYTLSELKAMCKDRGLTGYSKKSEVELIEMLKESSE